MYRKQVRSRRAVLVLLVIVSLVLLSSHFSEGSSGPLHGDPARPRDGPRADRGGRRPRAEAGARPRQLVRRDLRGAGRERRPRGRGPGARASASRRRRRRRSENEQLRELLELGRRRRRSPGYEPVTGRVIGRSPTVWYSTVTIDVGSSSGVARRRPGDHRRRARRAGHRHHRGTAQVTLITDHRSAVSATVVPSGPSGVRRARGRRPRGPAARLHRERPPGPRGRDPRDRRLDAAAGSRPLFPLRDPDRPGHRGDGRRAGDVPAQVHVEPVRRHARARLRRRCSPSRAATAGGGSE